jgi:hypothetical protein
MTKVRAVMKFWMGDRCAHLVCHRRGMGVVLTFSPRGCPLGLGSFLSHHLLCTLARRLHAESVSCLPSKMQIME